MKTRKEQIREILVENFDKWGYCQEFFDLSADAILALHEVTDADIVKYAFNCYPDSYNMRVACINGARDMRNGEIKHIEK